MNKSEIISRLDVNFFNQLREHPLPPYHVSTWSRDCDMCEGYDFYVCHTYIDLCRHYADWNSENAWEWAEGPRGWCLVDAEDMPEKNHYTVDRVARAVENGGSGYYV